MIITIDHLTKSFPDTVAVNDLSICIPDGKLIALLGPSGCGKSTLLNMISGIFTPSEGKIFFDNNDVTDIPPEQRNVGLVFQNYALYPHMTVLENICFPLKLKKVNKKDRIERAMELARLTHIEPYLKKRPGQLSGGQQQRVAIARALAKQPDILLLDEPLSNLDAKLRIEMREEIKRIQRNTGITTIFVTHDQEEASSIADYIVLMKAGIVQQFDIPRKVYDNPSNLFVADFIGTPTINKLHGEYNNGFFTPDKSKCTINIPGNMQTVDKRCVLAIRPESIVLSDCEDNILNGSVEDHYMTGKDELLSLNVGGQSVRCYVTSKEGAGIEIGDRISFGLSESGVFLFSEQTGERYL